MTRPALVAIALFGVVACSADDAPDEPPTTTVTTVLPGEAFDELNAGDCLIELPTETTSRVETTPCARQHRAEVYATLDLGAETFPGAGEVSLEAAQRCSTSYERYAGEPIDPTTNQAFAEVVPTAASWGDGDRRVVCLVLPPGGATSEGTVAERAAPRSPP